MPEPISARSSADDEERWYAPEHQPDRDADQRQRRFRPLARSNTRAPHQVSANELNSTALAKSIDSELGTEPCRPSNMIEIARIRWALPHQASARLLKFCDHAKNSSTGRA